MRIIILFSTINFLYSVKGTTVTKDLTVLILSQENEYNKQIVEDLKSSICKQALSLGQKCPSIYLSHKFSHLGEWTIIPLLPKLFDIAEYSKWILILEERTNINLNIMLQTLDKYDCSENVYIGYGLEDETPTIIHHFREKKFSYPMLGAGIAISISLLQSSANHVAKLNKISDFNIDPSFEFSLFIWNEGNGTLLTHDDNFCFKEMNSCASFPNPFVRCEKNMSLNSIYFAVKTCSKFHHSRIPVVQNTWGKYADKLYYFSDVSDDSIPTISLGVPNTDSGHCEKTMRILQYAKENVEKDLNIQWIVVVDDDTILSTSRMLELLSCYDADDDVAIGERYGYGVLNPHGFNYITGGGGMVFSKSLISKIISCKCPLVSSPDDMVLGHCMKALGVKVTHSHLFHQARPSDYAEDFLKSDRPLSFHKHWMIDPIEVYKNWFAEEDKKLTKNSNIKLEL